MKTRTRMLLAGLLIVVGLLLSSVLPNSTDLVLAAGDASIRGRVTDNGGKAVRGAMVKATSEGKAVARYTNKDGRYQIEGLPAGRYEISVNAYGFELGSQTRDTAQNGETNFKLPPQNGVTRLTSAELRYLFPETEEARTVYSSCSTCHGLETVLSRRGMRAPMWQAFLPAMTMTRWGRNFMGNPERVAQFARGLENIFGPEGTLGPSGKPDLSRVKHTPVSDAALRATFTEYTIPSPRAMAHSVTVDDKTGMVWFSEYDAASNNMARFNPETEKFEEFPIPVERSLAHTGAVLKDGSYLVGLDRHEAAGKVTGVDRNGNVVVYEWPEKPQGARMVAVDPTRDNVVWVAAGDETWSLDVKAKKFLRAYKNPVPATFPESSEAALTARPGDRPTGAGYSIAVDSKGFPWISQLALGTLSRLEPAAGEWKTYHTPEMRSTRGIAVDAQDNVWFADYYGSKLGKLDPKTGQV
ncbi:MAG: carboxypeptidase regulatory-like domain-containing protein [Terriglobia bacterium]